MQRFRHLGLQRRIMLYVAIGLAVMLSIGASLGLLAIRQATQLVYDERLDTAFGIAATLERDIQEFGRRVGFAQSGLLKADSPREIEEIGRDLLAQLSDSNPSQLLRAQGLWLVDQEGKTQLALPSSTEVAHAFSGMSTLTSIHEPTLLFAPQATSPDTYFGTLVVPVNDDSAIPRWTAVIPLLGMSKDEPYLLPSAGATGGLAAAQRSPSSYGLEVLGQDGRVVLTRSEGAPPGTLSPHWHILQTKAPQPYGPFVYLHKPQRGEKFSPHVIAAAPLTSGPWVVILEQQEDVALALPLRLRQRLILFSGVGFVATMLVAWVTTRHVVKSTEQLTAAAQRIAAGKVETPIKIAAQDEIGALAESLETMRRRLQAWGAELERQVKERTSELEERNRELNVLYETLQRNERQLRALLGKVLGAQEEERKRVSRELHDEIGQALSALALGLGRLEHARPDQGAGFEEQMERLKQLAKDTLGELRRLTVALRPAALDELGLVPAIGRYAELYLGDAGVEFDIQGETSGRRLDPSLETIVYRVVQEAINNVARHSGATQAKIALRSLDDILVVTVEDNGRGFDRVLSKEGVGLQGMQERASLAGGKLSIDSQPGRGTTVRLEIPVTQGVGAPRDA